MEELNYIESQVMKVNPFNSEGNYKIKVVSINGNTNWLNITLDQLKAIEDILNTNPTIATIG